MRKCPISGYLLGLGLPDPFHSRFLFLLGLKESIPSTKSTQRNTKKQAGEENEESRNDARTQGRKKGHDFVMRCDNNDNRKGVLIINEVRWPREMHQK